MNKADIIIKVGIITGLVLMPIIWEAIKPNPIKDYCENLGGEYRIGVNPDSKIPITYEECIFEKSQWGKISCDIHALYKGYGTIACRQLI